MIYECYDCKSDGIRLYRQYQTFADNIRLLCVSCAEKRGHRIDGKHTMGWLVAAVPTDDGETFWGFTSVPERQA